MSIIISKTQNPQKIIMAFSGKAAVFPKELNTLSSSSEAIRAGFLVAAEILNSGLNNIDNIQAIQNKGVDCLGITLKSGQSWDDNVRGTTRSNFIKDKIDELFISAGKEIYLSASQRTPIPSQAMIDTYVASPPENSVIHKIKKHGSVRGIADTQNNILVWVFSGACAGSCHETSPRSTHSTLLTEMRSTYGNILQDIRNAPTSPTP